MCEGERERGGVNLVYYFFCLEKEVGEVYIKGGSNTTSLFTFLDKKEK